MAQMTDALSLMLASRDWLMADGATGTNLFNMGLESGEPPEFWNTDKPDNIRKLYAARSRRGRIFS
jgi:5-methyltetrahydrofolate--homocysteine methyltransferase